MGAQFEVARMQEDTARETARIQAEAQTRQTKAAQKTARIPAEAQTRQPETFARLMERMLAALGDSGVVVVQLVAMPLLLYSILSAAPSTAGSARPVPVASSRHLACYVGGGYVVLCMPLPYRVLACALSDYPS